MPSNSKITAEGVALGIAIVAAGAVFLAAAWALVIEAKEWQDPSSAALSPYNMNLMDLRELRGRVLG
ncbi:hypothetical protein PG993_001174 [Apiospora rasikravindrae]|uniref:Uncharacterized protein n=1 Tax=Apiospora rasikravindrae TaxID=990691 RepID=A0ABR1UAM1_9PEZI